MVRIVFFLLAVLAGGYAGYLRFGPQSGFVSYSEAQLDAMEEAHRQQTLVVKQEEEMDLHRVAMLDIREERAHRLQFKASLVSSGVFLLIGIVLTLVRRGDSAGDAPEASSPTGRPPLSGSGGTVTTREQAAAILGVRPDAPRAVVEAALQAQLAERDPAHLAGLSPNLKQNILQQREELTNAANVLLGRQELAFTPDPTQE